LIEPYPRPNKPKQRADNKDVLPVPFVPDISVVLSLFKLILTGVLPIDLKFEY